MYIPTSVRPSVIRPSVRLSVRPSVRLSVRPSVRLSVRPSIRPSVCPSVRSSVYVRMYIPTSVRTSVLCKFVRLLSSLFLLSVHPHVRPYVHSSVHLSVRLSYHPSVFVHPSVRSSFLPSIRTFIDLSVVRLSRSIIPSICPSVSFSIQ